MRYLPPRHVNTMQLLTLGLVFSLTQAHAFENIPTYNANAFVPKHLLSGQSHHLDQRVSNDGYMNHYMIQSKFGPIEARSNAELAIRVHEINAIAAMDQIKGGDEFVGGVTGAAGKVVQGAGKLATDPIGAVGGSLSGIGKLFQRGADKLSGKGNSKDSMLTGDAKRKYAREFGVDVYSTNPLLQQRLDELAGAKSFGSLSASAALMMVGGGAGAAISVTKGTQTLNEASQALPATELRRLNKKHLLAIGVSEEVAELFLSQDALTPTNQAKIIDALSNMSGTADRGQFITFAVHTKTEEVALFRQRQAQMYAAYHQKVKPISKFVALGSLTAGQTADGTLVFNVPLDYLLWTEAMAQLVEQATQVAGAGSREVWMTGGLSEMARKELQARGWKIHDKMNLIATW